MNIYERARFTGSVGQKAASHNPEYMGIPRFYLASNIYAGESGQMGLVLVDRKADVSSAAQTQRLGGFSTVEFNSPVVPAMFRDALLTPKDVLAEFERQAMAEFVESGQGRFFDQVEVMAALRLYLLPREQADALMQDRYLGHALIRKVCEEDLPVQPLDRDPAVPQLFVRKSTPDQLQWLFNNEYEVPIFSEVDGRIRTRLHEYGRIDSERRTPQYPLGPYLDDLVKSATNRGIDNYFPVGYVTFFDTSPLVYKSVTATLAPLATEVVQRFDDLWISLNVPELRALLQGFKSLPPGKGSLEK